MSRTVKGSKGVGYDYWSRRWGNRGCNSSPTRRPSRASTKQLTNRAERRTAKPLIAAGLFALLLIAAPLLAEPPSLDIPAEVRPSGQYVRLLPKTDAEGVAYIGLSGLDPFPSEELADSKKFILDTRGLAVGRYKFAAIAWSGADRTRFDFDVVVGDAPPVVIPPGPGPGPVIPPVVSGKRRLLLVHESADDTPEVSRLLVSLRTGAAATYLDSKGHKLSILDDDSVDASGKPAADVEQWRPHFSGMKLPVLFVLDETGKTLVHKQELPAGTSAAQVVEIVKGKGG